MGDFKYNVGDTVAIIDTYEKITIKSRTISHLTGATLYGYEKETGIGVVEESQLMSQDEMRYNEFMAPLIEWLV